MISEFQRKHYQYIKARYNVSRIEMEIIQWIALNGKKRIKEISAHFDIKLSVLNNIVDKIELQKYLVRKKSMEDKRIVYLELSKKGQRLYENYTKHLQVMAKLMGQKLTKHQFDILHQGLEHLEKFCS